MNDEGTRLNKFLASCAIGSRRGSDELIKEGRVEVNGQICVNPGTRVGPADFVKVDGKRVVTKLPVVVAFHKPTRRPGRFRQGRWQAGGDEAPCRGGLPQTPRLRLLEGR